VAAAVADADRDAAVRHQNEIRLVGRLAAAPVRRELPSGDVLVQFRLVVERGSAGPARKSGRRAPTVDTLECAAWRKDVRRVLQRCDPGDIVEVHGALRRRFWRSPGGAASRSEVEAARLRRLVRAAPAG